MKTLYYLFYEIKTEKELLECCSKNLNEYESIEAFEEEENECVSDYIDDIPEHNGKIYALWVEDYNEGNEFEKVFLTLEEALEYIKPDDEYITCYGRVKTHWEKCDDDGNIIPA